MYICLRVCTHIYDIYIYIRMCMYIFVCICIDMYMCRYVYAYEFVNTYVYIYMCIYIYVFKYVNTQTHMNIYMCSYSVKAKLGRFWFRPAALICMTCIIHICAVTHSHDVFNSLLQSKLKLLNGNQVIMHLFLHAHKIHAY